MKKLILLLSLAYVISIGQTFRDTLYYDASSGNYIISYVGVYDTLVTVVWEPATKIHPALGFQMQRLREDTFKYEYSVTNNSSSEQRLVEFGLEGTGGGVDSTRNGWSIHFVKKINVNAGIASSEDAGRFYWAGGKGLGRGVTTSGFKILSNDLPGITNAFFTGNAPLISLPDEGPSFELQRRIAELNEYPLNRVLMRTVAPLSIPVEALAVIDSLLSYISQSKLLGWIADDATASRYLVSLNTARLRLEQDEIAGVRAALLQVLENADTDSSTTLSSEAYALLRYNTEYLLSQLPTTSTISSYCLFAKHSLWLEQNSEVFSGDIGVNDAGSAPFLDSQVELSIGIGTSTASGYSIKANRIKVKQGATVGSDVNYNELDNNGTITGTLHTPLTLPLTSILPEFQPATPGAQNITVPQNGTQTLQPGYYGDILVRKNGKLTFTGGTYHLASFNTGDNAKLVFQAPSEVRIAGKFDTDQGTYIGPEDTTSLSANQIVFYIGGINGSNGNLAATPKAAQIGIANTVKANFYVPNGTLWIRQNSQATGAFIGKDVDVGIGVKVWLKSAF